MAARPSNAAILKALRQNGFPFDPKKRTNWYSFLAAAIEDKGEGKSLQEDHLCKEVLRQVNYHSRNHNRVFLGLQIQKAAVQLSTGKLVERYQPAAGSKFRYRFTAQGWARRDELLNRDPVEWSDPEPEVGEPLSSMTEPDESSAPSSVHVPVIPAMFLQGAAVEDEDEDVVGTMTDDDDDEELDDDDEDAVRRLIGQVDDDVEEVDPSPLTPTETTATTPTVGPSGNVQAPRADLANLIPSVDWHAQEGRLWQGREQSSGRAITARQRPDGTTQVVVGVSWEEAQRVLRYNRSTWPGYVVAGGEDGVQVKLTAPAGEAGEALDDLIQGLIDVMVWGDE